LDLQVQKIPAGAQDSGSLPDLCWNGTPTALAAGDLLTASLADVQGQFDVSVTGLLTAVQELLPDLKQEQGAVLVANGPIALNGEPFDSTAAEYGFMGAALAAAAKHKLVGLLARKLASEGIYIGEVMVHAAVKGTASDTGNPTIPTIDPAAVGRAIWDAYTTRSAVITDAS
jgi:NADP-dependent 3-hydroxy acid dehydrogenase YdfG